MSHIVFKTLPSNTKDPGTLTEFDTESAARGIPGNPRTVVIVAQKTSAGTATVETVIAVTKTDDVKLQGGAGSVAHLAAQAIYESQAATTLFMVYQDDAGGSAKAVGTITISGTFTVAGFLNVWIGSTRLQVSVSTADTPTDVATAIDGAINADADLPVTSAFAAGVVTVTAKNGGTLGNNIPISHQINDVVGLTVVDVQLTGGTLDPDIQDALDAIFPTPIRHVYSTYNDVTSLGKLKTHLDDSASPTEKNRRLGWTGIGYITISSVNSIANTLNEERLGIAYIRYSKVTEQGHSLDIEAGAAYLALYAQGANPALPRNGRSLPNIVPPALEEQFSFTDRELLLNNGVGPLRTIAGEGVTTTRTVSTRTSTAGIQDFTLLDIQTQDTLDSVASAMESMFAAKFSNRGITAELLRTIRSEILNTLFELQDVKQIRQVEENKDRIIVEEDATNTGQINVDIPAEVVPGLHVIGQKVTLIVGTLSA